MHSFEMEILFITILGLVVLSDTLAKYLKMPSVFLLLLGSYITYHYIPIAVPIDLKHSFDTIIIFCIPLIFMGDALHLHFSDIKKYGWEIFYLAVVAVALSITIGASLHHFNIFNELTLSAYVALFAINMATDAVSVQSVLSQFKGISHQIKVLIEGESLGNDATAVIAFFFIGLPWMMSGHIDVGKATFDALYVFAVSIFVGVAIGYLFYIFMKFLSDKRNEFFAFIVEAYLAFILAEEMHVSGILALITAIIATKAWIDIDIEASNSPKGSKQSKNLSRISRLKSYKAITASNLEYIYDMAKEFGYIAAVVIFFVLAKMINIEKLWQYKHEILIMFGITTLIRALSMAKFAIFSKQIGVVEPVGLEGWFVLTFSGMKGALSIILVHMIPSTYEYKELFEVVTTGVVTLSIFGYGTILWIYFTIKNMRQKRRSIFKK